MWAAKGYSRYFFQRNQGMAWGSQWESGRYFSRKVNAPAAARAEPRQKCPVRSILSPIKMWIGLERMGQP
jgi:hypothetical protein